MSEGVRKPWWSWLFLYARTPDGVTERHWKVLGALGATYLVNSYDLGLLNLALPQIQQGLGVSESEVGGMAGIVRLGVLPALVLNVLADRIGRRRLLLVTLLGFTICTFLTAFCRTPTEFVILQLLARMFIYSEEMLAIVVVTEELDAHARGWGIGLMVAFGAFGHGFAALFFSAVDVLPYGWRALYFIGAMPLLLIVWFRRTLQETHRFTEQARRRQEAETPTLMLDPLRKLLTRYPMRLFGLAAALAPVSFAVGSALQFQSKYLQEVHGYAPGHVSMLFLLGGLLAITGGLLCGRASDRFGRRRVLSAAIVVNAVGILGFYNTAGMILPMFWIMVIFTQFGIDVLFSALGSELFPTSYRSTASAARSIVSTVSIAAGLALEGLLYVWLGSHAAAISTMTWCALAAPLLLLTLVPETAGRELEEIAPDED
ncbi:MAG TPA: MFS transporter [Candidatus Binatia bacterium]|nr:MFS transporter [Candidatus Binatia bacterium]